jgi:trigger factor
MNTTATDEKDLPEGENTEAEGAEDQQEEAVKLQLDVKITEPSACERHVTVTIPREDIDRYFEAEYDELVPKAEVPGFRPGRAPRKLVVNRFKDTVGDQVKGKLLVDCMEQVSDDHKFAAISEPDFDLDAVVLPDDGPMTFEFTLEVRPEFDLPTWKGLTIDKPVYTVSDDKITAHLKRVLNRFAKLSPREGGAEPGDYLTLNIRFLLDGETLSSVQDQTVPLRPKLSLRDAELDSFGELMAGVQKGDKRETTITLSEDLEDEARRGQTVQVEFEVTDVDALELPKLTPGFLTEIGGFESEEELRDFVRGELERQAEFQQQQEMRKQITSQLTATAQWDLPPNLLRRQAGRELQRMMLELRSAGYSDEAIQQHANQLQRNTLQHTSAALKEHFILEKIAEEEKIDAEGDDYDKEIARIADQSGTSPRRVRSRLEKRGEMDALRNQVVERKVIELITAHALVRDKEGDAPSDELEETAALDHAICRQDQREAIPEAKHDEEGTSPSSPPTR